MPKQRITKEMIVEAAFEIAREKGQDCVLVREIAKRLDCSVQPVYSYCNSMDGLKKDLNLRVRRFVREFVQEYMEAHQGGEGGSFQMMGYAYVYLAEKEPHIFQMFALHEREGIDSLAALYRAECSSDMAKAIAGQLQISLDKARMLHRNMMIYNVGIGTVLATARPGIPTDEVYEQLDIAYRAFVRQAVE